MREEALEKIRILIADDDPGMRLVMRRIVEKSPDYLLAGEAADGEMLLRLYDETRPEVVLMDVEMPGMNGVECARAIQDRNPRTILVFATAHEEYMKSAFEVYAFDYLVKPFKLERALNTLRLIGERLRGGETPQPVAVPRPGGGIRRLMLRHKEGVKILDPQEIALVQREERSTVLYTVSGEKFVTSDSLSEMEKRLSEDLFFRSHKSYIVNLGCIESVLPYGRWTYVVRLKGLKIDALITHERYETLQQMFE